MEDLSFERFCEFIREFARLSRNKKIVPETLFEKDLGITADDGCELLEATEKRFGIRLCSGKDGYRGTFHLGVNEFLFHSEGFGSPWGILRTLFTGHPPTIRRFTVGELYAAVEDTLKHKPITYGTA
ncbi:MAG: hypothetical protein ABSG32_27960 [Terriglobia bacterium]|jgi:hypothetical protein